MKTVLLLISVLLAGACATTPTPEEKVVGTYVVNGEGDSNWTVFLMPIGSGSHGQTLPSDRGLLENYSNDKISEVLRWRIVDKEVHAETMYMTEGGRDDPNSIIVFRINTDHGLTDVAFIIDGKRSDIPKEKQKTLKKIGVPTIESVTGAYEGKVGSVITKFVFLKNGKVGGDPNSTIIGAREKIIGNWRITGGEIHFTHSLGPMFYPTNGMYRHEPNGDLTLIATWVNPDVGRQRVARESQHTLKKIK